MGSTSHMFHGLVSSWLVTSAVADEALQAVAQTTTAQLVLVSYCAPSRAWEWLSFVLTRAFDKSHGQWGFTRLADQGGRSYFGRDLWVRRRRPSLLKSEPFPGSGRDPTPHRKGRTGALVGDLPFC